MSLGVILFLLYRLPEQRRWILPLALAFEAYTVFEIMYLGTHTPTDVVVGFTFAVAAFCLYRVAQHRPVQPVVWPPADYAVEIERCVECRAGLRDSCSKRMAC